MRSINVIEVPASDMKQFNSSAYTDGAFFCQSSWARFFSNNVKYMGFYDNAANFLGGFCIDHRKILFYVLTNYGDREDVLTIWHKGMLLKHDKDYEEKNFTVSDEIVSSIFFEPRDYDREKWWKAYKNEFLE